MKEITFGITSFRRPKMLADLVASIRYRYPDANVLIADNGHQLPALPDDVRVLSLPFDSGLSAARNALIDHLTTEYLCLLEDDFRFTDETRIEPLMSVMQDDPLIGVVGGAVRGVHGRVTSYALDIEVCRRQMRLREATHRWHVTDDGTPYRLCDMVWNFGLFRRSLLIENRWIDELKVGEHCPFFYELKLTRRWRVASCSLAKVFHVPDKRPSGYLKYRRRGSDYFKAYLASRGIQTYERLLPYHFEDDDARMPPVLVLAVGHSGTTVVAKMLAAMGWNLGKADDEFAENVAIRRLNQSIQRGGTLDRDAACEQIARLPKPWVIKDPRFVETLTHWLPVFELLDQKPVLLCLERDAAATLASYDRRNAPGDVAIRFETQRALRDRQYEAWPWGRFRIRVEQIANAANLIDAVRLNSQEKTNQQTLAAQSNDRSIASQSAQQTADGSESFIADGSDSDAAAPSRGYYQSRLANQMEVSKPTLWSESENESDFAIESDSRDQMRLRLQTLVDDRRFLQRSSDSLGNADQKGSARTQQLAATLQDGSADGSANNFLDGSSK